MKTDAAPMPEMFTGDPYQPKLTPGTVVARHELVILPALGNDGCALFPPRVCVVEYRVMDNHYVGRFTQYKPNAE